MVDFTNFWLDGIDEKNSSKVLELNMILSYFGISFEIKERAELGTCLTIKYDTDKLNKIRTRNAGRHKKNTAKYYKIADVIEMKKSLSENEILKTLEISRSTYYRRLKEINNNFLSDDCFF